MSFKKGDIVVRIIGTFAGMRIDDMDVVQSAIAGGSLILEKYQRGPEEQTHSGCSVRLATENEIHYYNQGIRNIADIPQELNYLIY